MEYNLFLYFVRIDVHAFAPYHNRTGSIPIRCRNHQAFLNFSEAVSPWGGLELFEPYVTT